MFRTAIDLWKVCWQIKLSILVRLYRWLVPRWLIIAASCAAVCVWCEFRGQVKVRPKMNSNLHHPMPLMLNSALNSSASSLAAHASSTATSNSQQMAAIQQAASLHLQQQQATHQSNNHNSHHQAPISSLTNNPQQQMQQVSSAQHMGGGSSSAGNQQSGLQSINSSSPPHSMDTSNARNGVLQSSDGHTNGSMLSNGTRFDFNSVNLFSQLRLLLVDFSFSSCLF